MGKQRTGRGWLVIKAFYSKINTYKSNRNALNRRYTTATNFISAASKHHILLIKYDVLNIAISAIV